MKGPVAPAASADQEELRQAADQTGPLSAASFNSQDFWLERSEWASWAALSVDQPSPPTELQSPEELTPQMMADMTELIRVPVAPAETAFNLASATAAGANPRQPMDQSTQPLVASADQEELRQAADQTGPLSAASFNSQDFWLEPSEWASWAALSVDQPSPPTELQSPEELTPQMMADLTEQETDLAEATRGPVAPAETAIDLARTTDEYNNADRTIHLVEGQPLVTGPQRRGLHGLGNLEASAVAGPTEVPGGREEHSAMSEVPAEPSDPTGGGRKRRTTEKDADPRPSRRQTLYAQRPLALAPDLSAANASITGGASTGDLVNRAAFQKLSAEDRARLDEIKAATPRKQGQTKAGWADDVKEANPDISAAHAAIVVGTLKHNIAVRAAFRTLSAEDQARLDEIKAATPRLPVESNAAYADRLKARHPDISAADAAYLVGGVTDDITKRAAFQTLSAQDQAKLDEIARQTPQLPGQSKAGWADDVKEANPDISAADAAYLVGAIKHNIARRAAFRTLSAEDQARLDEIKAATPRLPGQSNAAYADRLKARHPDISAADAAEVVGTIKHNIARRAAFQTVSAQDQARLDEIKAATPREQWESNAAYADRLKAVNPDLSAALAAIAVGSAKHDIARRAAFQTLSAQDQARLDEIARRTPQKPGQSKAGWADDVKEDNPDISAAHAAMVVGAMKDNIAVRTGFQKLSAEDRARLDEIKAATPRKQGQSKGDYADDLKAVNPDLSAALAAIAVGSSKKMIAGRASFKVISDRS
ncbi:hypothetical protein IE4803_PB00128 (plasmid) [Rhizobium etli bv. phaseoli str. IE4803]|nr:hypothetical protein IE4803_PB00128 [Rhizobium etli bv. phaseoli str. IE4803]